MGDSIFSAKSGADLAKKGLELAYEFGKESIKASMEAETTKMQFRVLGGRTGGLQLYKELSDYIHDGAFGPELYSMAEGMMANGLAVKSIMPNMRMLGNVAMGDMQRMKQLTNAFSQTAAAGKLTAETLKQYLAVGFDPLRIMSEKTGKSMAVLRNELNAGKITFDMVGDAMKQATSECGIFYNTMDKYAQTTSGKLAKLKGGWTIIKERAGNDLASVGNIIMDAGIDAMHSLHIIKTKPEQLVSDKDELNALVSSIIGLEQGNKVRVQLIDMLKDKFSEFGSLDHEKASNEELLSVLDKANGNYNRSIYIAGNQEKAGELNKKIKEKTLLAAKLRKEADYITLYGKETGDVTPGDRYNAGITLKGIWDDIWDGDDHSYIKPYKDASDKLMSEIPGLYAGLSASERDLKANQVGNLFAEAWELRSDPKKQKQLWGKSFNKNHKLLEQQFNEMADLKKGIHPLNLFKIGSVLTAHNWDALEQLIHPGTKRYGASGDNKSMVEMISGAITGGGEKQINIHIKSFAEKFNVYAENVKDGGQQVKEVFERMFLEVLMSANAAM